MSTGIIDGALDVLADDYSLRKSKFVFLNTTASQWVAAGTSIGFTGNTDNTKPVYLANSGKEIHFNQAGVVRVDVLVNGQKSSAPQRLWCSLNGGDETINCIAGGEYSTVSFSTITSVTTSTVLSVKTVEATNLNAGGATPCKVCVSYL